MPNVLDLGIECLVLAMPRAAGPGDTLSDLTKAAPSRLQHD
jgi:hypothetical protein